MPQKSYEALSKEVASDYASPAVAKLLLDGYTKAIAALAGMSRVNLTSQVPGKSYFSFKKSTARSRAINEALWEPDRAKFQSLLTSIGSAGANLPSAQNITKVVYSATMAFCAYTDIHSKNQKTPGTFFEYLIGHLIAKATGTKPQTQIQVVNLDEAKTCLPTDLIFNLGKGKRKFHVPVKTSTRERAIQIWAHQRVLDGVHGTGIFRGIPVLMAETKTDANKGEVIEICLPDQWRLYQSFISQLTRVYYLDMPCAYQDLASGTPPIVTKLFGEFFHEWKSL